MDSAEIIAGRGARRANRAVLAGVRTDLLFPGPRLVVAADGAVKYKTTELLRESG